MRPVYVARLTECVTVISKKLNIIIIKIHTYTRTLKHLPNYDCKSQIPVLIAISQIRANAAASLAVTGQSQTRQST